MQTANRKAFKRITRRKRARIFWRDYGKIVVASLVAAVLLMVGVAAVKINSAGQEGTAAADVMPEVTVTAEPITEAPTQPQITQPENEYPFNLMSADWSGDEMPDFRLYEIPAEYVQTGGFLPEVVQRFIYATCQEYGVDYAMVLAVIEIESGYRWNAAAGDPSFGYMQIIEQYHTDRMERLGVDNIETPYFNIMVGIDYLAELQGRFDTEAEVLTAYNYGVSGAYKHIWNKGLTESDYSRKVQQAKARIMDQLGGGAK